MHGATHGPGASATGHMDAALQVIHAYYSVEAMPLHVDASGDEATGARNTQAASEAVSAAADANATSTIIRAMALHNYVDFLQESPGLLEGGFDLQAAEPLFYAHAGTFMLAAGQASVEDDSSSLLEGSTPAVVGSALPYASFVAVLRDLAAAKFGTTDAELAFSKLLVTSVLKRTGVPLYELAARIGGLRGLPPGLVPEPATPELVPGSEGEDELDEEDDEDGEEDDEELYDDEEDEEEGSEGYEEDEEGTGVEEDDEEEVEEGSYTEDEDEGQAEQGAQEPATAAVQAEPEPVVTAVIESDALIQLAHLSVAAAVEAPPLPAPSPQLQHQPIASGQRSVPPSLAPSASTTPGPAAPDLFSPRVAAAAAEHELREGLAHLDHLRALTQQLTTERDAAVASYQQAAAHLQQYMAEAESKAQEERQAAAVQRAALAAQLEAAQQQLHRQQQQPAGAAAPAASAAAATSTEHAAPRAAISTRSVGSQSEEWRLHGPSVQEEKAAAVAAALAATKRRGAATCCGGVLKTGLLLAALPAAVLLGLGWSSDAATGTLAAATRRLEAGLRLREQVSPLSSLSAASLSTSLAHQASKWLSVDGSDVPGQRCLYLHADAWRYQTPLCYSEVVETTPHPLVCVAPSASTPPLPAATSSPSSIIITPDGGLAFSGPRVVAHPSPAAPCKHCPGALEAEVHAPPQLPPQQQQQQEQQPVEAAAASPASQQRQAAAPPAVPSPPPTPVPIARPTSTPPPPLPRRRVGLPMGGSSAAQGLAPGRTGSYSMKTTHTQTKLPPVRDGSSSGGGPRPMRRVGRAASPAQQETLPVAAAEEQRPEQVVVAPDEQPQEVVVAPEEQPEQQVVGEEEVRLDAEGAVNEALPQA